jgi:hypothetical protein
MGGMIGLSNPLPEILFFLTAVGIAVATRHYKQIPRKWTLLQMFVLTTMVAVLLGVLRVLWMAG